jgi:hypothetical protein
MSMMNVFIEPDRVRVVTDRAYYFADDADVLAGLYDHPKLRVADNALFVIAGRGSTRVIRDLQNALASAACVDIAVVEIAAWFANEPDPIPDWSEGEEIVVAGVALDGTLKAFLWRIAGPGASPEVRQLDETILRPAPPEGATLPAEWTDARIMAAARWVCTAPQRFEKRARSICGGTIDMATCTAAGVSVRPLGAINISGMIGAELGVGERYPVRVAEG